MILAIIRLQPILKRQITKIITHIAHKIIILYELKVIILIAQIYNAKWIIKWRNKDHNIGIIKLINYLIKELINKDHRRILP
jgi:hypothetical protein